MGMSAGNGNLAKMLAVTPIPAPLSATEREQQRIAYITAVDNMARTLRQMVPVVDGILQRAVKLGVRVDALERAESVRRSSSFLARLNQWRDALPWNRGHERAAGATVKANDGQ